MSLSVGIDLWDLMQAPDHEPLPVLDFRSAARVVLQFLQARCGMSLWMVTRTEGDDWIVIDAEDHGYGVKEGDVFAWKESFCARMVEGLGPRCARDSRGVPAYAAAPLNTRVPIQSYVGVPLRYGDGSLFGTLCAISPTPQSEKLEADLPMIELMGSLLSALLVAELRVTIESRSAERARSMATRDELTGLFNRRGWEELLAAEEARCHRYGSPACVVSIDLDHLKTLNDTQGHDAGDALLRRAARVMEVVARTGDVTARIGGDEFAILILGSNQAAGDAFIARLRHAFAAERIESSIGVAARTETGGLIAAMTRADEAMYEDKRRRKLIRVPA